MKDGIVFIDNEFVSPEHARMSIFDVGFVSGDCAYDVTSTWKGWFFMLEEHLDRFLHSCDRFQLKSPYSRDEIRQICAECAVYIVQSAVQDGQTETLATEPANQDDSGNDDQADDNEHHDC